MDKNDQFYMQRALVQGEHAGFIGEVPIGAVIVKDGEIIGAGHNLREHTEMATQHAEIRAIDAACANQSSWRLEGAIMYVTIEPCLMCAGAILNSRIDKVVYGASNQKAGAVESLYHVLGDERQNHQVEVRSGVMGEQASNLMRTFFQDKRKHKRTE